MSTVKSCSTESRCSGAATSGSTEWCPPLAEDALVLGAAREEPQEAVPRQPQRLLPLEEVGARPVPTPVVEAPALVGGRVAPVPHPRHTRPRPCRGLPGRESPSAEEEEARGIGGRGRGRRCQARLPRGGS